jgi:argininosuccinate synthase
MRTNCGAIALAFSGGLDTSFCVPWLLESGWNVHTVHVDTGGLSDEARSAIRAQAVAMGAAEHHDVDARRQVFDRFVRVLLQGNVLRGGVYPLSVAAERTQQAIAVIEIARTVGARAVAHGSTGAGNDQVRFDVAFRALAPELEIVTPVRSEGLSREAALAYLAARGLPAPPSAGSYSVNRGLWGTTWGGGWTHDPWCPPPTEMIDPPADAPAPIDVIVDWERGVPVALDGRAVDGPDLVTELAERSAAYGIGRGIHIGETALGIMGRIGFEAGAAHVLIPAHREIEKLVLTRWQSFWRDQLAQFYGDRLHEGQWFDPALRDIEALIESSQARVTGQTRVRLAPGRVQVVAARSPYSLLDPALATYGEESRFWTGADARSFARIAAIPSMLAVGAAGSQSPRAALGAAGGEVVR